MTMCSRLVLPLLLSACALLLGACTTPHGLYKKSSIGRFYGYPKVIWKAPNSFTFVQDDKAPFYYVTSKELGSQKIVPRTMRTDGGTTPRPLWVFADLSPWRFLPAYLIHDWLYEEHLRKGNKPDEAGFQRSADILVEGIKTLMATRCDIAERPIMLAGINAAVRSNVARKRWNGEPVKPTECTAPGRNCITTGQLCPERLAGKPCIGPYPKCGRPGTSLVRQNCCTH